MGSDEVNLASYLREARVNGSEYRPLRTFCKQVGVDFPRWSRIEAGRERPTLEELTNVARVLNVPLGRLTEMWEAWTEAPPIDTSANICHKRWTL